ncbi:hypothetical protein [Yersinia frederiksenii]|nr:hypothetical protein [Yersinia frederiksenii]ATM98106.1 hypothetical protein CRN75_15275 [Yersinia frederiksenii]
MVMTGESFGRDDELKLLSIRGLAC